MKTETGCLLCLVRQFFSVIDKNTTDEQLKDEIISVVFDRLSKINTHKPAPYIYREIFPDICQRLQNDDPYMQIKDNSNRLALNLLPEINKIIEQSGADFRAYCLAAISSNIIDFGPKDHVSEGDVIASLRKELGCCNNLAEISELEKDAAKAARILYIADNCGEIVYDILFIEKMLDPKKVTLVVRGGPVINDVTLREVEILGLSDEFNVISSGVALPGTDFALSSKVFQNDFNEADLIISKGQGNFETLWPADLSRCMKPKGKIYFCLKVKCEVVAEMCNVPVGNIYIGNRQN